MFDWTFYMQNLHFLLDKLDKSIFHKNLNVIFSTFPYTHAGNTLLIDDVPYKIMFNSSYSAIFLESFGGVCGENWYFLGFVLPYFENLHSSGYNVPTFVEHNPFGKIKCINPDNLGLFKMLFVIVVVFAYPHFVTMQNWNWNKKYSINYSNLQILLVWISQNFPFEKNY